MALEQTKLDVSIKNRTNIFNWRGQFTPEFVEYILVNFSEKNSIIADPFSGSGTVLQESARLQLSAIGFEINPAAYAMSKFFTFCNFSDTKRKIFCDELEQKLFSSSLMQSNLMVYVEDPDYRTAYSSLLDFADVFGKSLDDKLERVFFLNLLFQSEKDKNLSLKDSIIKSFHYVKKCLLNLPFSEKKIIAFLSDARNTNKEFKNNIDLILTSPPYINVFNYHQNYRGIIEKFNFDLLQVAHSEFGSNRKNRGNRFKTVIQYCLDMELAIHSFWDSLKPNGKMILVVGRESNVRKTAFLNSQLIKELIENSGGFCKLDIQERKFINKFGNSIKEDIIIATKNSQISNSFYAREIALKHLESNLSTKDVEIKNDILEAIKNNLDVNPSPYFNPKKIIKHEYYAA